MTKCNVLISEDAVTLTTEGADSQLFAAAKSFFKAYKPVRSSRIKGTSKLVLRKK